MISCPVCGDTIDRHSKDGCLDCMEKAIECIKELKQHLVSILEDVKEE